jgi:catechol 2,3-dioxygenase-like lactoylglutathione lyase family enzyme
MSLKQIHNFDYVILLCRDLKETRGFYRDVMGFPVEFDSDRWVSFRVGAARLALKPRGPSPAWDDGPAISGSVAVQLAFRVPPPALDACHAELVEKGVPIVRPPTDIPAFRHRALFFRDPEDNVIEIYAEY